MANPDLEDAISLSHVMRILHLKAQVLETQGHMDNSSETYELAMDALDLIRNQVYKTSGKASLQEDALSLLADAAGHYYRKLGHSSMPGGDLDPLFSVVQQGKAALLTDHLRMTAQSVLVAFLPISENVSLCFNLIFHSTRIK